MTLILLLDLLWRWLYIVTEQVVHVYLCVIEIEILFINYCYLIFTAHQLYILCWCAPVIPAAKARTLHSVIRLHGLHTVAETTGPDVTPLTSLH